LREIFRLDVSESVEGNEKLIRKFTIKSRGKKILGHSRFIWKDNINIDVMEVLRKGTGFSWLGLTSVTEIL
jgi:hypothetical protein